MGDGSTLLDRFLTSRDAFEKLHTALQEFIALHINEVCAGQSVLRNKNGLTTALNVIEQFGRVSLVRMGVMGGSSRR